MTTSTPTRSIADTISKRISAQLGTHRERHVRRVTDLAVTLAGRFGIDRDIARLVGLAHDMDRELPSWRSYALVADWRIPVTAVERRHPKMLHGAVAAARLQREFGVSDRSVITAVRHHTLGHPDLDEVGFLIFVADYCEPGRSDPDEATRAAILAERSLETMVTTIIDLNRRRFGPLEEPTGQLYARLTGADRGV